MTPQTPTPALSWLRAAWIIERTRQQQGWNLVRYAKPGERLRRWGGLAFRILWPLGGTLFGAYVFRGLRHASLFGDASANFLLAMLALFTALLLFVSAIKFAYQTFFGAPDLPLLQSLPLPTRGIFVGKYLDNLAFSNQLVSIFALGPFLAYGLAFDWSWSRLLVAVLGLLYLPVYTTALGILVSVPISRFVSRSRMRETLMLGSMAASVACYALMRQAIRIEMSGGPPDVHALLWDWLPVSWLASWAIAPTDPASQTLLAQYFWLGTTLFVASAWLGDMAYQYGISHLELEAEGSGSSATPWLLRIDRGSPSPARAFWFKDLLTFSRDPRQWYYLVFFGVLFFLPVDPTGTMTGAHGMGRLLVNTISNAFIVVIMATMALQELSVLGYSREGSRRWLLHALPLRPMQLLLGKFQVILFCTLILATFGVLCLLGVGQLAPADVLPTLAGSLLMAGTLNFAFLSLGARWPDFEGYAQRQRVSPTLALAIALVDGVVIGVFLLLATLLASYTEWAPWIPALSGISFSVLLGVAVGIMGLTLLGLIVMSLWNGFVASKRVLQER